MGAVLIYSKLVDLFKKHHLFYIICTFYGILFSLIGAALLVKEWYGAAALGKELLATVGWVSYFATESFGSLVVALFWSFTNSITDTESAKRGFPFIVVCAQIGAILGSLLLVFSESIGSIGLIVMISSLFIFAVIFMVAYFMKVIPADQMIGNKAAHAAEKKKDGFFEGFISGLTLLLTRPYLIGVLVVSTFYEVAMQILEYQMNRQAGVCFSSPETFCRFEGWFGVGVNVLSFLVALLGTSYLIKRLGTRISLLVYPIVFAITLAILFTYFKFGSPSVNHLLWATFAAVLIVKGMSYAFNNPIKEMMYIPTSKDAKFKSKGWVDMFGGRFSKAGGAQVTNAFKHNMGDLMVFGTAVSFGLIGVWIVAALFVGKKNQELIRDGKIIE
jgi:AAA family ATP:ADP antiporter